MPRRTMIYCLIPQDLAKRLHDLLRRHFAEEQDIEVVVEQRWRDRRRAAERRQGSADVEEERRRIRAAHGRRVADRRELILAAEVPAELPRRARPYADRLLFITRFEPTPQHLEDIDTARLVARIQSGDQAAFGDLYLRYFDRVYSYLRVAFRDDHEAEDLTQDVFLSVLDSLPRYERRQQPFRAWLFVIVRRKALTRLERARRQEVTDPIDLTRHVAVPATELQLEALDWLTDRELVLLIERLPLAQRQVLMLRYALDLDYSYIAEILDRSVDDVRMIHHRARRFLEERMRALGRHPEGARERDRSRTFLRKAPVLRARRFALTR